MSGIFNITIFSIVPVISIIKYQVCSALKINYIEIFIKLYIVILGVGLFPFRNVLTRFYIAGFALARSAEASQLVPRFFTNAIGPCVVKSVFPYREGGFRNF